MLSANKSPSALLDPETCPPSQCSSSVVARTGRTLARYTAPRSKYHLLPSGYVDFRRSETTLLLASVIPPRSAPPPPLLLRSNFDSLHARPERSTIRSSMKGIEIRAQKK